MRLAAKPDRLPMNINYIVYGKLLSVPSPFSPLFGL